MDGNGTPSKRSVEPDSEEINGESPKLKRFKSDGLYACPKNSSGLPSGTEAIRSRNCIVNETIEIHSDETGLDTQDTEPYSLPVNEDQCSESVDDACVSPQVESVSNYNATQVNHSSPSNVIVINHSSRSNVIVITPESNVTNVVDLTVSEANSSLQKHSSIQADAREMADLLETDNITHIYDRLNKHRLKANRKDIVANELLEGNLGLESYSTNRFITDPEFLNQEPSECVEDTSNDENDTFLSLYSDIDRVKLHLRDKLPTLTVDPNLIYAELEANINDPNRVRVVSDLLLQNISSRGDGRGDGEGGEGGGEGGGDGRGDGGEGRGVGDGGEVSSLQQSVESELVDEVDTIMKRFPTADENEVFALLREIWDFDDRLEQVIDKLLEKTKGETLDDLKRSKMRKGDLAKTSSTSKEAAAAESDNNLSSEEEALMNNDPIYKDTCFIAQLFPNRDKNEIYAYLEAHHGNKNRIALVTEELLRLQEHSQENRVLMDTTENDYVDGIVSENGEQSSSNVAPSLPHSQVGSEAAENGTVLEISDTPALHPELQIPIAHEELQPLVQLEKDVETLRDIFPDCDPMWLYSELASKHAEPERVERLSAMMFETRNYPKLKDRLDKEKKEKSVNRVKNMTLNIPDFLDMFPDPVQHFYSSETTMSEAYKQHCKIYLRNTFPMATSGFIGSLFTQYGGHLTPIYQELNAAQFELETSRGRKHKSRFRSMPREEEPIPEEPDEYFYRELLFVTNEKAITAYLKEREDRRNARLLEARKNGELVECGCCYDDEMLPEDALTCPAAHRFCTECVRRSSEEVIGQAKVKLPCLTADCSSEFDISTLKKALTAKVFSNLLRKIQEEELRQAAIENLVSCPFCSFASIMENDEDRVFKCLNPDCCKESCRRCREPAHIPLRCEEVERQGETSMRTFIETRMTEAMLRECYCCHKRFYKTEGCNKMTCTCGASMCYVCREPITGYDHFGADGCPQDTDVYSLHQQEMERAARLAREKYMKDNPEVSCTTLKHNPLEHLGEPTSRSSTTRSSI